MRRTGLLALAIALTGCGDTVEERPRPEARAAEPQRPELGWRESYHGPGGERLVFLVEEFEVTRDGWTAEIGVSNLTPVRFGAKPEAAQSRYGLMLFETGDLQALEEAASSGSLPPIRTATEIDPEPPESLAPGATWRGRISASGSLPAGSYVRVVFGPLDAWGEPPEGIEEIVVWISDRSYRLRP